MVLTPCGRGCPDAGLPPVVTTWGCCAPVAGIDLPPAMGRWSWLPGDANCKTLDRPTGHFIIHDLLYFSHARPLVSPAPY